MNPASIKIIKFPVNNWHHLYSLEQAILRSEQATGKNLSISGKLRNDDLFNHHDTDIEINFYQLDGIPNYEKTQENQLILGKINYQDEKLISRLPVDAIVFEELRKNLMEYADIDGIHIIVTLGLLLDQNEWQQNHIASVIKLDYAMRGDA